VGGIAKLSLSKTTNIEFSISGKVAHADNHIFDYPNDYFFHVVAVITG